MKAINCIGCGGKLQNEDSKKPFYTPKKITEDETIYCQRCYRMRHYGEITPSYINKDEYLSLLQSIPEDVLVVKVIDLFDIEGSIMPEVMKMVKPSKLIVVANKFDLLPKSVKKSKLKQRLNAILHTYELRFDQLLLISAEKNQGIDELIDALSKAHEGKDIYVIGAANVGKSTLINHMINAVFKEKRDPITTFFAPGTTQNFIAIPFENVTLYDTPGLLKKNHMFSLLDDVKLKTIQPKNEIKPRVYQLEVNQTIFVGSLLRMDFLKGLPSDFVFYFSSGLNLHRTKMINADTFYEKHKEDLLKPNLKLSNGKLDLSAHQFPLKRDQKTDIVIPGLGFFSMQGMGVIRLYTFKGIVPYQRESLI